MLQSPTGKDVLNEGHQLEQQLSKYQPIKFANAQASPFGEGRENYSINYKLAKQYGVDVADIHQAFSTAMGTTQLNQQMITSNYNPNVYVQLSKNYFNSPEKLYDLYVKSHTGKLISLRSLGSFYFKFYPNMYVTYDNVNSNQMSVTFKNDNYIQGIRFLNQALPKILPKGYTYSFVGQAGTYVQDQTSQLFIFIAAFLFIYRPGPKTMYFGLQKAC